MKLKRTWALAAAIVLSMSLALGTTLAYLTDTDQAVNVMTLGNVDIEQLEYERVVENGKWVSTGTTDKYGFTPDKIQEFKQNKPLYPAVFADGAIKWDDRVAGHQQSFDQIKAPGAVYLFDDSVKNAVDKFVFVENTGKSDAYVRTLFAFEQGAVSGADFDKVILTNGDSDHWSWETIATDVVIKDNTYVIACATYLGPKSNPTGILAAGAVTYPSLTQLYMSPEAGNKEVADIDGNSNGTYEILTVSQAVQTMGFADAKTALDAGFGKVTKENAIVWFGGMVPVYEVSSAEELKDALSQNQKSIYVNLGADVTYDVAAWDNDAMGGDTTEDITIYGNGHTITFNQTNSDWNNIVTKNGAKLTIEDANITNAGKNDGPWNRHDLNFACDVELKNVKSDKALAFKAGAKLTNVTINDANTSDTYAIWIQPNGQTVELNGVTIDMLACEQGRGIKIDEQYVSDPAKVTLKVADTTFKTEEKSAIIVKSKAGADIILNNVNIEEVVADKINPVWVDEASEAYADLVTVTGGTKIVEGK